MTDTPNDMRTDTIAQLAAIVTHEQVDHCTMLGHHSAVLVVTAIEEGKIPNLFTGKELLGLKTLIEDYNRIVNAYGGFHERTPVEIKIEETLSDLEGVDGGRLGDLAELLALVEAGRGLLWKVTGERDEFKKDYDHLFAASRDLLVTFAKMFGFPHIPKDDEVLPDFYLLKVNAFIRHEMMRFREKILNLTCEVDLLRGKDCAQNMAEGRGPCGCCITCLRGQITKLNNIEAEHPDKECSNGHVSIRFWSQNGPGDPETCPLCALKPKDPNVGCVL